MAESIYFFDKLSERDRNFKGSHVISSDSDIQEPKIHKYREVCRTNVDFQPNGSCRGNSFALIQRTKNLYPWKVPWIIIFLSVIQVCIKW